MILRIRVALAVAATILTPLVAMAADYEPPIVIEEAPEYVPVEVGSGWYLRGDIGYNINKTPYDFTLFGVDTRNTRITGSIGAGYYFTDYFRGELNFGFLSNDRYDATVGTTTLSAESNVWSGMANVYADLGTIAGFTPYVGAGLGLLYASNSVDISGPVPAEFHFRDTQYPLAYALNAGFAYQVAQNTKVDVGYQYLSAPDLEYADVESQTIKKGVDYHQFKLGLRYDLW
ncbi:MAG: hypothetical protein ABS58_17215 [Mesorhizobium sp. SCN 65-20]|nr:MAG: hypothetical protein ABS58_17215 [Mesorhizobium sp. SCN 65-20]